MSSRTITSAYQMRKRRYPADPAVETVRPNCKQITKVVPSTALISKSPSPIAYSPNARPSVRDTSMRFLCSQSDSQPEISWNCNSPEFNKPVPRCKAPESGSDNIDMLSLIHNTFNNTTPAKKNEEKKNSLLDLWMAPTVGNNSHLPKRESPTFTQHINQPDKPNVGEELEQLVAKVKRDQEVRPHPVNTGPNLEVTHCSEKLKVIGPLPSTSRGTSMQNREMEKNVKTRINITSHLDDGNKSAVEQPKSKNGINANLSREWSDEDLFNDEAFIEQTQKIMDAHTELCNSQAPTQKIVITSSDDDSQGNTQVYMPNPLQKGTTTIPQFTALRKVTAASVTGPNKTELKNQNSNESWDCDDGLNEIMCTLDAPYNKDDSLDYLMNCDTQPYPATNEPPSSIPNSSTTGLLTQTQILEENVERHEPIQISPWKFHPLPDKGNNNVVGRVTTATSIKTVLGPNKPSVPSSASLLKANLSKTDPPKASSQQYTLEEIELKRQAALQRRQQKMEQKKQPTRCRVIYSQIMPSNVK